MDEVKGEFNKPIDYNSKRLFTDWIEKKEHRNKCVKSQEEEFRKGTNATL